MKKHRLFVPVLLAFFVLTLGTSLVIGLFSDNSNEGFTKEESIQDFTVENDELQTSDANLNDEELEQSEPEDQNKDEAEPEGQDKDEAGLEDLEDIEEEPQQFAAENRTSLADENDEKAETQDEQPEPEAPEPDAVDKEEQLVRVTAATLNVRPDPSTNNERIDVLEQGQTVEVTEEQDHWLQVKLPTGAIGWVSRSYVNKVSTDSAKDKSLAGRVIAIDPGHGGSDPGAVGPTGLQEKEVNLDVSLRVAEQLRAQGAQVVMTRDSDVFIPLDQRAAKANSAGVEIFVSIHANAHPDPQIGGTETYYFAGKATSGASSRLADSVQRQLVGAVQLRDIGVKTADFLVIRQTSMPSILVELGFLSNSQEESLMGTNDFRQNAAEAVVQGIENYFN